MSHRNTEKRQVVCIKNTCFFFYYNNWITQKILIFYKLAIQMHPSVHHVPNIQHKENIDVHDHFFLASVCRY